MAVPREDPYAGHNFEVILNIPGQVSAQPKGSFSEVSGLEVAIDPIDYRFGTDPTHVRKIPGLHKLTNIVLKRGITGDLDFWNWVVRGINGASPKDLRTSGSIILKDEAGAEVMRWNFTDGWPCKFTGPGLNAKNNEIALETLEICHQGLSIDGQTG